MPDTIEDAAFRVPHPIESCYGSRLHCLSCGIDEPGDPCYLTCLECWHVYPSEQALIDAHNAVIDEHNRAHQHEHVCDPLWCGPIPHITDASKIFHCALCLHDF